MLEGAVGRLVDAGYEVQTRRIALPHWDRGLGELSPGRRAECLRTVAAACAEAGIDFCGVGAARRPDQLDQMADLLAESRPLNGAADGVGPDGRLDPVAVRASARVVKRLAEATAGALGSFQFACGFCIRPATPFFPVAFADGPCFAIAFENSDLVVKAFAGAGSLAEARERLIRDQATAYQPVAALAHWIAEESSLRFAGLDTSIASSLEPAESVIHAFDSLGVRFGARGTLSICGAITDAIQAAPVPQTGYRGLMLPVMEDVGLAEAATRGDYGIDTLMMGSSVCGVGVDTVPVPGDIEESRIESLMLDVGTLAVKWNKPLSVRVLPAPGKRAGEVTEFVSPYLFNCKVFEV
jgi:uncharacterized protein (UPF0210 family)